MSCCTLRSLLLQQLFLSPPPSNLHLFEFTHVLVSLSAFGLVGVASVAHDPARAALTTASVSYSGASYKLALHCGAAAEPSWGDGFALYLGKLGMEWEAPAASFDGAGWHKVIPRPLSLLSRREMLVFSIVLLTGC